VEHHGARGRVDAHGERRLDLGSKRRVVHELTYIRHSLRIAHHRLQLCHCLRIFRSCQHVLEVESAAA
jgi:hypothetical protein